MALAAVLVGVVNNLTCIVINYSMFDLTCWVALVMSRVLITRSRQAVCMLWKIRVLREFYFVT